MKIIKVTVDVLPTGCIDCDALILAAWAYKGADGKCRLIMQNVSGLRIRDPKCPLTIEWDNKKIASEVM